MSYGVPSEIDAMKWPYLKSACTFLVIALLAACGGGGSGGGSGSSSAETLSGVFIDSPVQGLRWESGDLSGTTDAAGTFQYTSGATIQFYVGDILLGEATGDSVIIPLNLVVGAQDISDNTVTNIVRFLITIDNDNNPANGIDITATVADLTNGESVDFSLSTEDFAGSGDLQVLVSTLTAATEAGACSLTTASDAQTHIENSIKELLAGSYSGTYSGDGAGTWAGTVSTSGILSGSATSSAVETTSFSGTVSSNGNGETEFRTSGGASDGTVFSGTFKPNGNASGTWNWFGEETGTWSGSRDN